MLGLLRVTQGGLAISIFTDTSGEVTLSPTRISVLHHDKLAVGGIDGSLFGPVRGHPVEH